MSPNPAERLSFFPFPHYAHVHARNGRRQLGNQTTLRAALVQEREERVREGRKVRKGPERVTTAEL